jgi:hypothetical protein
MAATANIGNGGTCKWKIKYQSCPGQYDAWASMGEIDSWPQRYERLEKFNITSGLRSLADGVNALALLTPAASTSTQGNNQDLKKRRCS